MTLDDFTKQMDKWIEAHKDLHKEIQVWLKEISEQATNTRLALVDRPTFEQAKTIAKDRHGGMWAFLGGIVGGIVAFVTSIFVGSK